MLRGIDAQRRREGEPLCLSILRMIESDPAQSKFSPAETAAQTGIPGALSPRLCWADETPPHTVAAEQAVRTLKANYATLEASLASLTAAMLPEVQAGVPAEKEQTRVLDEQTCLAEHAAVYWDAITHEPLPAALTDAARQEELSFMNSWKVWDVVPISECKQRTGKAPLKGRWVDVNKGDMRRPIVRCRWVAKEFNTYKSAEFFAATPPLEALRMMISHAASGRTHGQGGRKLLVIDARKAHLHAMAEREVYVDLPPEQSVPGMCSRLNRCLYGTRDAPARWEAFLAKQLALMGFKRGKASPCCFRHKSRDLR